jgi:hypothetical protein
LHLIEQAIPLVAISLQEILSFPKVSPRHPDFARRPGNGSDYLHNVFHVVDYPRMNK